MFEAQHFFGSAKRLQAQSIGQPGQRRFFLAVESEERGAARLWLEKEQLQALGLALEQLLSDLPGHQAGAPDQPPPDTFPVTANLEIQVGRLAIGQDETELETGPRFVVLAYDAQNITPDQDDEPSGPATFACRTTRDQLRVLSRNIADVVASGRPRCPLCGEPVASLDLPHGCVRTNGHHS